MSRGRVMQAVIQISGVMSDSLRESVAATTRQLGVVDKKALATAAKFTALAATAAAAAGSIAGVFIKSGVDYTRTMNGIAAQTGAAGKELQELSKAARNVWVSGKGENFQEVADALVNIKQASGLAGEELEAAANASMLLKDTFGMESQETTRAATALMKNFGISAEEAYGIIAVGAQNGANKNGDLLDTLNEYSVHYKALGLSADQFVQSLIAGAEAGAFSIDKVGDAVKEFTIRSKDASKTSMEAYKQIGLDAETMTAAFAAGGIAAEAAFFQTVKALDAMKDPVAKNAAGVALFGTQFEDLEAGVLKTLGSMKGATMDAKAALEEMERVKYNDLGYAITQITRSFQNELIPSAEAAGQGIYKHMPAIKASIAQVTPYVAQLGQTFAAALPGIIDGVSGAVAVATQFAGVIVDNWNWIGPIVGTVTAAFVAFKTVTAIMAAISTATALWATVSGLATGATTALTGAIALLGAPITATIAFVAAVVAAGALLINNWDTIKAKGLELGAYLAGVWESIKTGVAEASGAIVGLFSVAFEALPGILKAPVNAAISLINGAINGINNVGFTIPDWVPGIGGQAFKVNVPKLPMLAAGGFTDGVSIAGEAGTEAVISFDPAYRAQNIGYLAQAADMLGVGGGLGYYTDKINSLGGTISGGGMNVTYNLGGITFSPTVTITGADAKKASIIEQLRNYQGDLLDLIEELLASKEAGNYGGAGAL